MFEKDYTSEKSYVITKLDLITSTGKGVDLYPQMTEMSIFEDIYNSTISGHIAVGDNIDFLAKMPLSGFEFISLGIGKPGSEREIVLEKVFRVYKLESIEIKQSTTSIHSYLLHFCSEENLVSASRRISRSYRSKTSSEIIRDIIKKELRVSDRKMKGSMIEDSVGKYDIIIPYLNPLSAISWIATRTTGGKTKNGKSTSANFMFFENTFGYNFKSIDNLFQQPTKAKYKYRQKNVDIPDDTSTDEIRDVIRYEFMNTFDTLSATMNGMYSGIFRGVDLTTLKVTNSVFDYDDYFKKTNHLQNENASPDKKNAYPFHNDYEDRFKKKVYKNELAMMKMYPTNRGHDSDSNIAGKQYSKLFSSAGSTFGASLGSSIGGTTGQSIGSAIGGAAGSLVGSFVGQKVSGLNPNLVESWMMQRISQINQLNYFKLKLVVPGDTYITVGDVIEFELPLSSGDDPGQNNSNPYYSGRYLITAIRHRFNYENYEMIIEATRDCLSQSLPTADSGNPLIDEAKSR